MKFVSSAFSCAGPEHENQDAMLDGVETPKGAVFAVADGVGGAEGGAVASSVAISTLHTLVANSEQVSFQKWFQSVRQELGKRAEIDEALSRMGTTLSVCVVKDNHAKVGHVGDSRVYHLRGEGIMDRTRDQTETQELIDRGILTKARAKTYRRKHVLLSALSPNKEFDLFQSDFEIEKGDRIILLTDGVHNVVPRRVIRDISVRSPNAEGMSRAIKAEVEGRGTSDDYTAICVVIMDC